MLIPIICQIFLYLISYTTAQPNFVSHVCQDTFGNYTANSAFKKNLDTLFSTISSDTKIDYGFYNFSVGKNFDIVNGIGLCRPDVSATDCRRCLNEGAQAIVQACPYQKDGIGWYDQCMLRYSDRYIFGKKEFGPWYPLHSLVLSAINKGKYNQTASTLLTKLQAEAASGDYRRKFAAGKANVTSSFSIYALVQCTPDLESFDCYDCLESGISYALTTYYGEQARVFFTSCNIRYENYEFYDSSSLISLDSPPPPAASASRLPTVIIKGKGRKRLKILIEILLPIIVTSLLLILVLFGRYFRRRTRAPDQIKSKVDICLRSMYNKGIFPSSRMFSVLGCYFWKS
ncbi:hypothetical protein BVRB_8g186790 [Beta vulgaris subsp. vulgaris]|nr:hypothetical protein BVRB_8g186790 [Beta vulgaris subsp. vulgaris]